MMSKRILLSASFPAFPRAVEEAGAFDPGDIGLAAASVIDATLRAGDVLVFGGHPSISPLVLTLAELHKRGGGRVEVYESPWFLADRTDEVRRLTELEVELSDENVKLAEVRVTPSRSSRAESVQAMRGAMLAKPLAAAFFVGGMGGVEDELDQLRRIQPGCRCFLFVRPGGRVARIAESRWAIDTTDSVPGRESPEVGLTVLRGRGYAALARRALTDLASA